MLAAITIHDDFTARATAWLDTVAPGVLDTVQETPRSTIIPSGGHSTAGTRAMAVLADLAGGRSLATNSQLRQGEVIGEGGMGVIRAAEQVALGRTVAVKTLRPSRRDPGAALDLLREAWVTGSLEHPNIVPVHYLELDEHGIPVIVLKRISGVEWSKLITDVTAVEARFGTSDLLAWNLGILLHVLNAIRFAHTKGVIHRDLKPSNVMIGDFGEVYLLDWGIAVSMRDDGSGRMALAASATELAGTPCYMAPEMLGREGSPPLSERTDVYLAGAVLFELITGKPPHDGPNALAVIASVIASEPVLPPSAPPELAAICLRAMATHPDDRFESADALRLAIQDYLEHRGSANLGTRAAVRLDELLAILARPIEGDADETAVLDQREMVYRLFGACRFGFLEALAVWRDNAAASAGLTRATVAVAEYELATGNPRAAVSLLGDLDVRSPAPAELVARARAAADEAARHHLELEKLRRQHDSAIGRRTRSFLAAILGVTFSVLPLVNAVFPREMWWSHEGNTLWALGAFLGVFGFAFWARNTLRSTLFNRRVAATVLYLFLAQTLLSLGAWALDIPVAHSQVFMIFLWGTISWMLVINLDPWLAPSAVILSIGFLVAARFPDQRYYVMSATNFAFTLNVLIVWRPATIKMTPEERVEFERANPRRRPRA